MFGVSSGTYACDDKPDIYGDLVKRRAQLQHLRAIYGCSYEERDGKFVPRHYPPGVVHIDNDEGFVDEGLFTLGSSKLGGLRARVRFVRLGPNRGAVLGFRPIGMLAGVVRKSSSGELAIENWQKKLYPVTAASTPQALEYLNTAVEREVIITLGIMSTSAELGGATSGAVTVQRAMRVEGLF